MRGDDGKRGQIVSVQPWFLSVSECDERAGRESALIRAGLAGDRAALEELLAGYERPLFVFCRGVLGHREDAEDAVQDALLRALRALPRLREGAATFRGWLFKIALHVCLDRKSGRRPTELFDEERPTAGSEPASPEVIALRRLQIEEGLNNLPPVRRAVFLLKVVEGWSVEEIAAAVGWKPKRVYNELYKARCALAEWRGRDAEEGEIR
jgi:RNA polymerase sigma-70 factor (ECF subfamily)